MTKIIENLENEIWKDIQGYEGLYQVSNMGRVRSLDRIIYNKGNHAYCNKKGKILKPNQYPAGYIYFILCKNDITKTIKAHRLVAEAFCHKPDGCIEVNHINAIRDDNRVENLEWVTRSGNIRHKFLLGYKIPSGVKSHVSKLKESDLPIIINLYNLGVDQPIIAKAYGVSQGTISHLVRGVTYKEEIDQNLAINLETIDKK